VQQTESCGITINRDRQKLPGSMELAKMYGRKAISNVCFENFIAGQTS